MCKYIKRFTGRGELSCAIQQATVLRRASPHHVIATRCLSDSQEHCSISLGESNERRTGIGGGHPDGRINVLVRDFVFHSLYAPGIGYFQQTDDVVGSVWDRNNCVRSIECGGEKYANRVEGEGGVSDVGVVSCGEGLDFNGMFGELEYRHTVAKLYEVCVCVCVCVFIRVFCAHICMRTHPRTHLHTHTHTHTHAHMHTHTLSPRHLSFSHTPPMHNTYTYRKGDQHG